MTADLAALPPASPSCSITLGPIDADVIVEDARYLDGLAATAATTTATTAASQ